MKYVGSEEWLRGWDVYVDRMRHNGRRWMYSVKRKMDEDEVRQGRKSEGGQWCSAEDLRFCDEWREPMTSAPQQQGGVLPMVEESRPAAMVAGAMALWNSDGRAEGIGVLVHIMHRRRRDDSGWEYLIQGLRTSVQGGNRAEGYVKEETLQPIRDTAIEGASAEEVTELRRRIAEHQAESVRNLTAKSGRMPRDDGEGVFGKAELEREAMSLGEAYRVAGEAVERHAIRDKELKDKLRSSLDEISARGEAYKETWERGLITEEVIVNLFKEADCADLETFGTEQRFTSSSHPTLAHTFAEMQHRGAVKTYDWLERQLTEPSRQQIRSQVVVHLRGIRLLVGSRLDSLASNIVNLWDQTYWQRNPTGWDVDEQTSSEGVQRSMEIHRQLQRERARSQDEVQEMPQRTTAEREAEEAWRRWCGQASVEERVQARCSMAAVSVTRMLQEETETTPSKHRRGPAFAELRDWHREAARAVDVQQQPWQTLQVGSIVHGEVLHHNLAYGAVIEVQHPGREGRMVRGILHHTQVGDRVREMWQHTIAPVVRIWARVIAMPGEDRTIGVLFSTLGVDQDVGRECEENDMARRDSGGWGLPCVTDSELRWARAQRREARQRAAEPVGEAHAADQNTMDTEMLMQLGREARAVPGVSEAQRLTREERLASPQSGGRESPRMDLSRQGGARGRREKAETDRHLRNRFMARDYVFRSRYWIAPAERDEFGRRRAAEGTDMGIPGTSALPTREMHGRRHRSELFSYQELEGNCVALSADEELEELHEQVELEQGTRAATIQGEDAWQRRRDAAKLEEEHGIGVDGAEWGDFAPNSSEPPMHSHVSPPPQPEGEGDGTSSAEGSGAGVGTGDTMRIEELTDAPHAGSRTGRARDESSWRRNSGDAQLSLVRLQCATTSVQVVHPAPAADCWVVSNSRGKVSLAEGDIRHSGTWRSHRWIEDLSVMLQDRRSLTTTETQGVEGERLKDAIMVKMLQGAAMYMITEVTERCRQCVERWQQHCSEGTVRRTEPEETAVALMGMTAEEAMSMAGDDGVYTTSGSGTGSGTGGEDDGSRKGRARREAPKRTPGGAEGARRSQRIGAHIGATASPERAAMKVHSLGTQVSWLRHSKVVHGGSSTNWSGASNTSRESASRRGGRDMVDPCSMHKEYFSQGRSNGAGTRNKSGDWG